MLYPIYNNGPFIIIPLNSDLDINWKALKKNEITKVQDLLEFNVVFSESEKYLCMIDVRGGKSSLLLVNAKGDFLIPEWVERPFRFKSSKYEVVFYREPIETIRSKGREFVRDSLADSLCYLLNERLEQGDITLELHGAILKDYKEILNKCLSK